MYLVFFEVPFYLFSHADGASRLSFSLVVFNIQLLLLLIILTKRRPNEEGRKITNSRQSSEESEESNKRVPIVFSSFLVGITGHKPNSSPFTLHPSSESPQRDPIDPPTDGRTDAQSNATGGGGRTQKHSPSSSSSFRFHLPFCIEQSSGTGEEILGNPSKDDDDYEKVIKIATLTVSTWPWS